VGDDLWFGLATGKIIIYNETWEAIKEFVGCEGEVLELECDTDGNAGIVCVSEKGVKLLDGLLEDDYCGKGMMLHQADYCTYRNLCVLIVSWNVDAIRPYALRNENLFEDLFKYSSDPDIIVIGLQELVDLEKVYFICDWFG
jgi:hypothetical protein